MADKGYIFDERGAGRVIRATRTVEGPDFPRRSGTPVTATPVQNGNLFAVRLTQTGGSAGTSSAQCSFTYTVKDITNTNTLGTSIGLTGNGTRVVNAAMTAGTYGMAYWHTDGTIRLLLADEKITQTNCT
jgi:hypothetical protein